MADIFLAQPLQVIAGSVAGSKWMSDDLFHRAASAEKHFQVDEAVSVLASFFELKLWSGRNEKGAQIF